MGALAALVVGAVCWRWFHHREKRKVSRQE